MYTQYTKNAYSFGPPKESESMDNPLNEIHKEIDTLIQQIEDCACDFQDASKDLKRLRGRLRLRTALMRDDAPPPASSFTAEREKHMTHALHRLLGALDLELGPIPPHCDDYENEVDEMRGYANKVLLDG